MDGSAGRFFERRYRIERTPFEPNARLLRLCIRLGATRAGSTPTTTLSTQMECSGSRNSCSDTALGRTPNTVSCETLRRESELIERKKTATCVRSSRIEVVTELSPRKIVESSARSEAADLISAHSESQVRATKARLVAQRELHDVTNAHPTGTFAPTNASGEQRRARVTSRTSSHRRCHRHGETLVMGGAYPSRHRSQRWTRGSVVGIDV